MLSDSIVTLGGIGEKRAEAFARLGVRTVGDLLTFYPRAYQDRGNTHTVEEILHSLTDGESGVFSSVLSVAAVPNVRMIRRGMVIMKLRGFDETGAAEITYFNQQYLKDFFQPGREYRFFGRFTRERGRLKITAPIAERFSDTKELSSIVPVYPMTAGLNQKIVSTAVKEALKRCVGELEECHDTEILSKNNLASYPYTIKNIHAPESLSALSQARRRMAFDEFFFMFLSIARNNSYSKRKNSLRMTDTRMADFAEGLPFELTEAQARSVGEIISDMSGEHLMNRILTGDVGSGKTVVAEAAAYAAVKNGYRACVMVPTEILANQHYAEFSRTLGQFGINVALLTGSTTKKERMAILMGLSDEYLGRKIDVVVGTHALISDGVDIDRLGLAVIDEQHRFGVMQRSALFKKAAEVHSLVMTATPIPRTLTLTLYGSIDVSRIDALPKGRQVIDTFVVNSSYRERLNAFIKKQSEEGHQSYVVCPSVEEKKTEDDADELYNLTPDSLDFDAKLPLRSATSEAEYLSEALPELNVALVHGKLKADTKDRCMSAFSRGDVDVLVATTVVEVGVNVPNATLMIVHNAERFGLSQLHQLRGRVGRGSAKSYFILVSDSQDPVAKERLNVLKMTRDGFEIAEHDLKIRGPGDFFGESGVIRQSGATPLNIASSCADTELMKSASAHAKAIVKADPSLEKHPLYRARVERSDSGERTVN